MMVRIYIYQEINAGSEVALDDKRSHYLTRVMRHKVSDQVLLFNEACGEWLCEITEASKSKCIVTPIERTKEPSKCDELHLFFAPIKNDGMIFIIEKGAELGVTHFHPVLTERCNVSRVNTEKLQKNAVEAAEQCERLDIPVVVEPTKLIDLVRHIEPDVQLFICRERGKAEPLQGTLSKESSGKVPAFLIGPEGGFSESEIKGLSGFATAKFVSLGPRILRAETACLAAITCYQAIKGDWQ